MATKDMKQLSNSNYFVVLLLITLIVLGATGFGVKMLVTSIVRDSKVAQAKSKANKQEDANLTAAPQLVANFQNLGPTSQLLSDALPNAADFPGLVALMENLSLESGVSLKSISPSNLAGNTPAGSSTTPKAAPAANSGSAPTPQTLTFSVAFDGTYQSLQRLMTNLEQSARPMRVSSLQLSGSGNNLAIQFEGVTYYQDKATVPFRTETVK